MEVVVMAGMDTHLTAHYVELTDQSIPPLGLSRSGAPYSGRCLFGSRAASANSGISSTVRPACSSSSRPWQSATNREGSSQAITTRRIPVPRISCAHGPGRDLRWAHGSGGGEIVASVRLGGPGDHVAGGG